MLKGHFITSEPFKLFVCQYGDVSSDSAVVVLPPVLEELNLSRAVIAKSCHRLAQQGMACFLLDYAGTGDSEGELEQVTPVDWINNVLHFLDWLAQQGIKHVSLCAYRYSALMISHHWESINAGATHINSLVLLKPVLSGKALISQLQRLKKVAELKIPAESKQGENNRHGEELIEVAGYRLNNLFIEQSSFMSFRKSLANLPRSTHIVELGVESFSPAMLSLQEQYANNFTFSIVSGSIFWQVPEIFVQPQLNEHLLHILSGKE